MILTKLINKMKKVLKDIADFIRKVFSSLHDLLEDKSPLAVRIAQKFKEAVEEHEGSLDWIVQKTETEKDDEALEFVKIKLPLLITELAIVEGIATKDMTQEQAWNAYVLYLKSKMKEGRAKDWIFLAGQILGFIIGKKAPIQALIMATQKAYQLIFGKSN